MNPIFLFIFQNSSIDDKLANFFGIDIDLNSPEETSSSIFLTLLNDLINFLLSKGCLIEDVRLLICCYVDILKCTAGKTRSFVEIFDTRSNSCSVTLIHTQTTKFWGFKYLVNLTKIFHVMPRLLSTLQNELIYAVNVTHTTKK